MKRSVIAIVTVIGALAIALAALVLLDTLLGEQSRNLYVVAPLQVVLGSVAFLLAITAIVAVFAHLGLQNKDAALALPEGSVRALLALILLIIFVIFGNIIYGQTQETVASTVAYSGLTKEQVDELGGPLLTRQCVPETDEGQADAVVCSGTFQQRVPNPDRHALGLQIVTGLLTLVTAIASFYFGAKVGSETPPGERPSSESRAGEQ